MLEPVDPNAGSGTPDDAPLKAGLRLIDLTPGTCRWPVAENVDGHLFCGEPARLGRPYCLEHARLAYRVDGRARPGSRPPAAEHGPATAEPKEAAADA